MRILIRTGMCLALSLLSLSVTGSATADPVGPVRSISVVGTGTEMFPAFDGSAAPTITRYAVTTEDATGGSVVVTATTSDPDGTVQVDGVPVTGSTPVTGLTAGDEVSVIIEDSAGRTAYSVMYLPAGFPRIDVTTDTGAEQPGLIGLTLNTFEQTDAPPAYDAIIDRNGVPVYAVTADPRDLDLKQQPSGEITVARPTTSPEHTGVDVVTLDDQLEESTTRTHVQGTLTNTDPHDSERLADGSTLLLGYEPNSATQLFDATIQKLDPDGVPVFTWTSAALAGETAAASTNPDYAHVNSIEEIPGGNGDVLVSFRHLSAVLRIATTDHDGYSAGDIVWKLGGRDSSFTFVDDPYGGPCAQHSASMLPNGHVLLFDNGTNGLCIDQSDPLGPTLQRGQTRIAEYALDTGAGTATLVWNYTPAGRYALFAGSARRLANGDTLIGWAADHTQLASEIDAAGNEVWAASAGPALPGHQKYITYRAALIPQIPDRTDPEALPTGPADGATYIVGDVVPAGARCTDRGGSNLDTCVSSGITGGRLDTSSTGHRTWSVTATDGAGNTTTVTRGYTVRLARGLPDGRVRRPDASRWKGEDVHGGPVSAQTVRRTARRGHAVTTYWSVQNDGERGDTLRLTGTRGTRAFSVHYYSRDRNITAAVVAGTYRTARLQPGHAQRVRVVVLPRRGRHATRERTLTLRAASLATPAAVDRVGVRVTVRR